MLPQTVMNLPAMQKTQVWSLGQEDPLEKGIASHSIIFAWEIPWTEEPGGLQSTGSKSVRRDWETIIFFHVYICIASSLCYTENTTTFKATIIQ